MSMMRCEQCERYIVIGHNAKCFVEERCICERCQESMLDEGDLIEVDGELKWPLAPIPPITQRVASFSAETLKFAAQCENELENGNG